MEYSFFMNGAELKKIRVELGLGQTALARLLGTPRITYVQWERGDRRIPGVLVVALRTVVSEHKVNVKK
jgi:DNA-binding transcriptional regulator YiaG